MNVLVAFSPWVVCSAGSRCYFGGLFLLDRTSSASQLVEETTTKPAE